MSGSAAGPAPDCEFCAMARGEAPGHVVLEGDGVLAFMDVRPLNDGHVLVIPRQHTTDLFSLPEETYRAVMEATRRVALVLRDAYGPPKVGMVVSGFEVAHAHIHVVPLHHPRDITSRAHLEGSRRRAPEQALREHSARIRRRLERPDPGER